MTASLTTAYTATHLALRTVATETKLGMLSVRVLLALAERGGEATTGDLIEDTAGSRANASGGDVRRSLGVLDGRGLVAGEAARGGARTQGVMTSWRLLMPGLRVAERVQILVRRNGGIS